MEEELPELVQQLVRCNERLLIKRGLHCERLAVRTRIREIISQLYTLGYVKPPGSRGNPTNKED